MIKYFLITSITTSLLINSSFASDDLMDTDFEGLEFQNILTSTRLKTSHRDAPASIST